MTTVLFGGRIHSPTHPDATAMAVRDGVVAFLGSDEVVRAQFPDAQPVNLDGAFVAPAFVDSHVHTTATGLLRTGLDLRSARSKRQFLDLLAAHANAQPDGIIWGHGWDETQWADATLPTTAELDAVIGRRAAYLVRIDMHSALASTALRDLLGGLDGSGPLAADAHHAARTEARARLSAAQRAEARVAALDAFAAAGVVAVHECGGPVIGGRDDWAELLSTEHGVEVTGYWGETVGTAEEARALVAETGAHGLAGDLFADGALGSHTAWLREPYSDLSGCCGNRYLDDEAIEAHLSACTEARIPAGFHVIGDAAVGAVVEALRRVVERHGIPAVARCGHRLEHVEMVDAEQAAELGSWGVIASMQPNFDALWGGRTGMYAQRLGADRAERLNPLALLASHGVPLAFGSDSPVTDLDPWGTVRAAVNHRTPGSAISARAAFSAATRGAWRAAGIRDGSTGTLAPGAAASYAVWDADDLEVSAPVDDGVQRWSTDPRSRVPALPRLDDGAASPRCLQTVHRGVTLFGELHA
ncbi:MAG: amidohydrolase [Mycobacterium sp.]